MKAQLRGPYISWPPTDGLALLPYMDAPNLARLSALDGLQDNLHPYIRTFAAARAAVPDGIGWLAPNRFFALEVRR